MSKKSKQSEEQAPARARARITVYPRPEILDPQGKQIREALARLGYRQVTHVRAGKSFEVEVESDGGDGVTGALEEALEEMCRRLLANPLVEEYTIEPLPEASS